MMALTREDLESLLRWLDEDPEFRAALRQKLLGDFVTFEVRLPTDWMERVDRRLENLEQDVAVLKEDVAVLKEDVTVLKQDVGELKVTVAGLQGAVFRLQVDVGVLKGQVKETNWRDKAGAYLGTLVRRGRDATEFVNEKLDEAEEQGIISPDEADFVRAADLLWMGTLKQGKFSGETIVFVGEISWTVEEQDVERARGKAQILRRAGVWAVPMAIGEEWVSVDLKEQAIGQKVLCAENGFFKPSRSNWEAVEQILSAWRP